MAMHGYLLVYPTQRVWQPIARLLSWLALSSAPAVSHPIAARLWWVVFRERGGAIGPIGEGGSRRCGGLCGCIGLFFGVCRR
jgi:hypothetical protein